MLSGRKLMVILLVLASCAMGCAGSDPASDRDKQKTVSAEQSPDEIKRLTTYGPVPPDATPEDVQRAWQQRWGLPDIATVPKAIRAVAQESDADGGLSFDSETLVFTQWVVAGASGPTQLRTAVQDAFDKAAQSSNLSLKFEPTRTSRAALMRTFKEINSQRTLEALPPQIRCRLSTDLVTADRRVWVFLGDQSEDPMVRQFFETRWPGLVELKSGTVSVDSGEATDECASN